MSLRYWLLIVVLGMGWGASFYFNAILLREVGPLTVSMGRVALGAAGCWAYVLATGRSFRLPAVVLGQLLVLGIVQFALPFAIYPVSQEYISSGAAGIINALTPIMVVIVSHLWPGGERATRAKSVGVFFGFSGIVILAYPSLRAGGGSEFWAILGAILAPVSYAVALNYVRRLSGIDHSVLVAFSLTGATIFIVPLALLTEGLPVIETAGTWAAFAVVGLVLTSASFILLYWLLPRVGATNISTVTFIAPVSAVLLGGYLLGEAVTPPHLVGMAAIFAGLLMIDGRILPKKRRRPAAA